MSKTPIFDETLWDHPGIRGTSAVFPSPVIPLYTSQTWAPVKRVRPEPTLRTFVRCLSWWKP